MALAFRDFSPHLLSAPRRGVPTQWEPLTNVVTRANQWLDSAGLRAVSIETLLVPVSKHAAPNPTAGSNLERWDEDHLWLQVVRVWHEVPVTSAAIPPPVAIVAPGRELTGNTYL